MDFFSKAKEYAQENPEALASGLTGLVSLATNIFGNSGIEKDQKGNVMATDIYGRPVYSSAGYRDSIEMLKDESKKQIGSSVLSGASSGAAAGAAFGLPGIGIGAIGGAIGGLIGGKRRKNQIKEEIRNRDLKLQESNRRFNADNSNYFEQAMTEDVNNFLLSRRAMRM